MKQIVKLHPRKCCVTGEGMDSGYLIGEGQMYIKYESDMIKHLREVEKDGNPDYDIMMEEGRITDAWLLADYYKNDYYYYTDWECPDDIQYVEVDGVMYEEGEDEFDKHFTHSWNKEKVTPKYNEDDYEYQCTKGDGVTEVWSHKKTGDEVYVQTEIKRFWEEASTEY